MANIIEMPKLSDTMTVGTLVTWLKKEGDAVDSGDMIAEVETDKATMEVECFDDGVILKHFVREGEQVQIGAPICAVGEQGEAVPEVEASGGAQPDSSDAKEPEEITPSTESTESAHSTESPPPPDARDDKGKDGRIKASPLARKIAEDAGIDLTAVEGSGPGGRIVKADVLAAKAAPPPDRRQKAGQPARQPAATPEPASAAAGPRIAGEDEEIPVTNMRAAIARALVKSVSEAPHFYLQMEVDAEPLTRFRADLNARLADLPPEQGGIKFSVNDLILKACAEAVRRVPDINRSWQDDRIIRYANVHLGVAVAVQDGLVTPVIRNAETKSLRQINQETRDLADKARNKKIKPEEMQGATLTVSNLGMFGISDFYGIINPPNAAIINVGATVKTPVVNHKDEIVVGYRMKVGLSGDHRTIDGAVGAQYLAALREIIETPALMLV